MLGQWDFSPFTRMLSPEVTLQMGWTWLSQLQCVCVCVCLIAQSCPPLFDPMDCSPPGSYVHGIFPGKNRGVGCHFLLPEIFPTQGSNWCLLHWQVDSLSAEPWTMVHAHKLAGNGKSAAEHSRKMLGRRKQSGGVREGRRRRNSGVGVRTGHRDGSPQAAEEHQVLRKLGKGDRRGKEALNVFKVEVWPREPSLLSSCQKPHGDC